MFSAMFHTLTKHVFLIHFHNFFLSWLFHERREEEKRFLRVKIRFRNHVIPLGCGLFFYIRHIHFSNYAPLTSQHNIHFDEKIGKKRPSESRYFGSILANANLERFVFFIRQQSISIKCLPFRSYPLRSGFCGIQNAFCVGFAYQCNVSIDWSLFTESEWFSTPLQVERLCWRNLKLRKVSLVCSWQCHCSLTIYLKSLLSLSKLSEVIYKIDRQSCCKSVYIFNVIIIS